MNYFEQVIFPPLPKISKVVSDLYVLDYWIIGINPKELWVKCPICHEVYSSIVVHMGEEMVKKYVEEYKLFHYGKAIRNCPNKTKHPEE